jgi:hypothetical protein
VTKTRTGVSKIGSCTTVQAARVARIACAVNLEKISELLCATWAFSIALDTSTVEYTGYLDFRVRVCVKSEIENLHVLAIPLRDRHTGEVMFNAMADVLDKLHEIWREEAIGVTTGGHRSMTGQVKGVASRNERETPDGMICRVWCGLHQLDLIMQRLLKDICDEEFYRELTSIIGHLRRQTNLIESRGCKCPTVADTRWLSAGVVTDWLSVNRGTLIEHYSRKPERLKQSRKWWLITMALSRIFREVNVVVQRLQVLTTLLSQQAEELSLLAMEIRHMALIVSPQSAAVSVTDEEVARKDKVIATSGQDYATKCGVEMFIKDLGIAAADIL